LDILKPIKRISADTVAITGNPDSALAKQCDFHLDIGVRSEADPLGLAPTSSSTATLVLGDALAIAVMETRGFKEKDFADLHPGGVLGKKLLLTVDQIFHKGDEIPLIDKDIKIQEALLIISEKGLGFTGVVNDSGSLIGIITDGDIRRGFEKGGDDLFNMTAEHLMTGSPKSIAANTLAIKALEIMEDHSITSLFVHETEGPEKLCGVIHIHDLLNTGI
jgi:arabinose-5-phosphate isomerase